MLSAIATAETVLLENLSDQSPMMYIELLYNIAKTLTRSGYHAMGRIYKRQPVSPQLLDIVN